jgi:hypothetical protein
LSYRAGQQVRRHPRLSAALAVLVALVVVGTLAYLRSRPPPLDTHVQAVAWFTPTLTAPGGVAIGERSAVMQVQVLVPAGADPVQVVALDAGGLGPARVQQSGELATVTSPFACERIPDLAVPPALPTLRVSRTDAWGRTVSATITVSDSPGTAEVASSVVAGTVRQECVGRIADRLTLAAIGYQSGGTGPTLALQVTNPTAYPLLVLGAQAAAAPSDAGIGATNDAPNIGFAPPTGTLLRPKATSPVSFPVTRANCANTLGPWGPPTSDATGRRAGDFILWVRPAQPTSDQATGSWTSLVLTAPQQAQVAAALTAPCHGAPHIAAAIRVPRPSGSASGAGLTVAVQVTATSGRLSLGPNALSLPWLASVVTGSGQGDQLAARVVGLDLSPLCGAPPYPPAPWLALTVRTATGTYPYRLSLGVRALVDALRGVCHNGPDPGALRRSGWAP